MADCCPYYQGVCGLDENFICFCESNYKDCDIYKKHLMKLIDEQRTVSRMLIDYIPATECKNVQETFGMICVKCGKCGRKFNDDGVMVDDGGTTPADDD